MNSIRSTWLGWGVLCVAGGGSYYFAKQRINADRNARYEAEQEKQVRLRRLEAAAYHSSDHKKPKKTGSGNENGKDLDHAANPSSEASEDSAAPVGHAPIDSEQKVRERSKYEAAEPYRSKKGDRFS